MQNCFEQFSAQVVDFDAVICANDFTAVSLVRRLQETATEALKRLPILSCAKTKIAAYHRSYIRSLNMNFEQYGKAAVYVYEALKKHAYLSDITVSVIWTLEEEHTVPQQKETILQFAQSCDPFYSDPELEEMLIIDKLLGDLDSVDTTFLKALQNGEPYEKISEACYLAEGSIKYRIKKMVSQSGSTDKQHLLTLLQKFSIVL